MPSHQHFPQHNLYCKPTSEDLEDYWNRCDQLTMFSIILDITER